MTHMIKDRKRNSRYENVIWDWNGTLLNDINLCIDVVNGLLVGHTNNYLDVGRYKNLFGFPVKDYYERIGINFNKESFDELAVRFISGYESQVRHCNLHENAIEVLSLFQTKGIQQYILTAAHKESVLSLLDHYTIKNYFKEIEGLDNIKAESKVNRGLELMSNNEIRRDVTVLIGDTMHDFEVANELGVDCILIANGHQSKRRLIDKTQNEARVMDAIHQLRNII